MAMDIHDEHASPERVQARFREMLAAALGAVAPAAAVTVRQAADAYLADRTRLKEVTRRCYRLRLEPFAARFATTPVADIKAEQVETWVAGRWKCPSTRRLALTIIGGALKASGWSGRLRKPPMRSAGADAVISPDTWAKVVATTTGDFRQLCRALWATGARPSELAGLTAADVDFVNGVATVVDHKTAASTGKKLLYLCPEAIGVLREQAERYQTGLLFRNQYGRLWTVGSWAYRFREVSQRIGVRVGAKFFRHTLATNALQAGIPMAHVAALLGHTSTKMVEAHYNHLSSMSETLKAAAAKVRPGPPPAA